MAARCETPEVVEGEEAKQITMRQELECLRKVKDITFKQWKTVSKMQMITTDLSMGNSIKKKAEVQGKVFKAMLENLKGGIYEAIVACEVWYPFEGKGADGPSSGVAKRDDVLQLLKNAHEDLKEARSCVVGTIQQLEMEGEIHNKCSHKHLAIWDYMHAQAWDINRLMEDVHEGRDENEEHRPFVRTWDDDYYTWGHLHCKDDCKHWLRRELFPDEAMIKKSHAHVKRSIGSIRRKGK